jgi:hypothetical protein
MEAAHFHIEENCGRAVDWNPRQEDIGGDHHRSDEAPCDREAAIYIRWMQNVVGAVGIDRRDGIQIWTLNFGRAIWHGFVLVWSVEELLRVFTHDVGDEFDNFHGCKRLAPSRHARAVVTGTIGG